MLAALIANRHPAALALHAGGETHLVVPEQADTAFLRGLKELGYLADGTQGREGRGRKASRGEESVPTITEA